MYTNYIAVITATYMYVFICVERCLYIHVVRVSKYLWALDSA